MREPVPVVGVTILTTYITRSRHFVLALLATVCTVLSGCSAPTLESRSLADMVVFSADAVWLSDNRIYFLRNRSSDSPDTDLWMADATGETHSVVLRDLSNRCASVSFRSLRRVGTRLGAMMFCAGSDGAVGVIIDPELGAVHEIAIPEGTVDLITRPDGSEAWAQYYVDGCISITPLMAGSSQLPTSPKFVPAILPTYGDRTLYFLTTATRDGCSNNAANWSLTGIQGSKVETLGEFREPNALEAREQDVLVAGERDGKRGIWRINRGAITLVALGEYVTISLSPDGKRLLAVAQHGDNVILRL